MKLLQHILAVVLCGVAFAAGASPSAPVAGTDYVVLSESQPVDTGKKVEVIEFFAYYCPHCYALEPALSAWVRKQGDNIVFKRVHVGNGPAILPQQKLYFSLESLGLAEQYHQKVFDTIHQQHNPLRTEAAIFDWVAHSGIDKAKFTETYNGFGVSAKVRRADRMMGDYRVDYWPMVIVDGKYMTSPAEANKTVNPTPSEAQLNANAVMVLDYLVSKAKAEKK